MSADIIVCMSTVDMPTPHVPSDIRWCMICAAEVWLSRDSAGLGAEPVCADCAPGLVALADAEIELTSDQLTRLRAAGLTDVEIARIVVGLNRPWRL